MSLESGRKFGYYASLMNVILPIVSIGIAIAIVFSIIANATRGIITCVPLISWGEKSGINNFKTAAILYIIGAIIPLVTWITWIFSAMAFNKLKPALATTTSVTDTIQSQSSTMQTKRCSNCGAENIANAVYCSSCGKPLQ